MKPGLPRHYMARNDDLGIDSLFKQKMWAIDSHNDNCRQIFAHLAIKFTLEKLVLLRSTSYEEQACQFSYAPTFVKTSVGTARLRRTAFA